MCNKSRADKSTNGVDSHQTIEGIAARAIDIPDEGRCLQCGEEI